MIGVTHQITFANKRITAEIWNFTKSEIPAEPLVGVDTETVKITLGEPLTPVTLQCYYPVAKTVHLVFGEKSIREYLQLMWARLSNSTLVFHNVGFDFEVLGGRKNPWLMWMVEQNRIKCLGLRYLLHKARAGTWGELQRWSLDHVVKELMGIVLDKDENIRLSFHPNMELTDDHVKYACLDPVATLEAFNCLPGYPEYGMGNGIYPTEDIQVKGAIVLYHIGHLGIMVDQAERERLRTNLISEMEKYLFTLNVFGYYPKTDKQESIKGGNRVLQKLLHNVEQRTGVILPRTETANKINKKGKVQPDLVKSSKDIIENLPGGEHPFFDALREFVHARKIFSTYFNDSFMGTDGRIHASFQPLVRTARTSCRSPNIFCQF